MFTLDAHTLSEWQKCKRLPVIAKTHRLRKWRPQSLLTACARHAVIAMSDGKGKDVVTGQAVNFFMHMARTQGLDLVGHDTYSLTMDYVAILKNFIEYLSRITLLTIQPVGKIRLSDDVQWAVTALRDESGILHRWEFIDYIPEDVGGELHKWEVSGDIAVADAPMVLHLVSIGRREKSHQISPWCRIFAHPRLLKHYKFSRKSGELLGDWKPVYFSENSDNSSHDWVNRMEEDGVINTLVRHVDVAEMSSANMRDQRSQILYEASEMMRIGKADPRSLPMSKRACDVPFICPHQDYCYSSLSLDDVGIYIPNSKPVQVGAVS